MRQTLKYSLLDDLELACANSETSALPNLELAIGSLGPLIQLHRSPAKATIMAAASLDYRDFGEAVEFLDRLQGLYVNRTGSFGFAVTSGDGALALELMQRALISINKSPLPTAAGAQAVSALGEFDSNIDRHSRREQSGFVAFEVNQQFVGLYASDLGQGMLGSLRQNPNYAKLDDSGEALSMALREGVSSSTNPGRGMGFRPIFVGLASHARLLRFRSDDALLEINRFGGGSPTQEIKERPSVAGFHAFVHCTFD